MSCALRNAALVYILDRYLHILLLVSALLPSVKASDTARFTNSAAASALAVQLLVIYLDAGLGKALDPSRAWSLSAPVAALDTYMRHTRFARLVRSILGSAGLRLVRSPSLTLSCHMPPRVLAWAVRVATLRAACCGRLPELCRVWITSGRCYDGCNRSLLPCGGLPRTVHAAPTDRDPVLGCASCWDRPVHA